MSLRKDEFCCWGNHLAAAIDWVFWRTGHPLADRRRIEILLCPHIRTMTLDAMEELGHIRMQARIKARHADRQNET